MISRVIAVTGGRDVTPTDEELWSLARFAFDRNFHPERTTLFHGDCDGVDRSVADFWEHNLGLLPVPFIAPWDWPVYAGAGRQRLGATAGPLRNNMMLRALLRVGGTLVAWPGNKGTAGCISQASALDIKVIRIDELVEKY